MAFFSKLKDRLFKSSSKLDEGLDAIVEDGGVEEDLTAETVAADTGSVQAEPVDDAPQGMPESVDETPEAPEVPKTVEPETVEPEVPYVPPAAPAPDPVAPAKPGLLGRMLGRSEPKTVLRRTM